MPDNSQSETCVEKTMKTLHKTNFFRIHLSAKDATREKPFADVSFYLNKTHIFEDQLVYRTRPTNRKIGLTGLTGPSSFLVFVFYHTQKNRFSRDQQKRRASAAKCVAISTSKKHMSLLNVTSWSVRNPVLLFESHETAALSDRI
jgi:hypothetical protein